MKCLNPGVDRRKGWRWSWVADITLAHMLPGVRILRKWEEFPHEWCFLLGTQILSPCSAGLHTRTCSGYLEKWCLVLSFFLEMQSESRRSDTLNPFFLPTWLRNFPSPRVTKICAADNALARVHFYLLPAGEAHSWIRCDAGP